MSITTIDDLIRNGDYEKALGEISKLDKKDLIQGIILHGLILVKKGNYPNALLKIDKALVLSRKKADKFLELSGLTNKIQILLRMGKFDEARQHIVQGEEILEELEVQIKNNENLNKQKSNLWYGKSIFLYLTGNLQEALNYHQMCLTLRIELGNQNDIANSYTSIGILYNELGDLDKALEYQQKSLKIRTKIGTEKDIVYLYINISVVYLRKGNLDKSLSYCLKALEISKKITNDHITCVVYNNIADVYRSKGELTKALDYQQKSISLKKKIGNKQELSYSYYILGLIYKSTGQLDFAYTNLQKALSLCKEIGNDIETSLILLELLILFLIFSEAPSPPEQYHDELQKLDRKQFNKLIHLRTRLAQALLWKHSIRMYDKAKAQELFNDIINEKPIIYFEHTLLALENLCELKILELKISNDTNLIHETTNLVKQIQTIAQEQHMFPVLINSMILQSKLAVVNRDIKQAFLFIDEGLSIVEEKGITGFKRQLIHEKQTLENNLIYYQSLIHKNVSLQKRLEFAQFESYFNSFSDIKQKWMEAKK